MEIFHIVHTLVNGNFNEKPSQITEKMYIYCVLNCDFMSYAWNKQLIGQ